MNLRRFLSLEGIRLELRTEASPSGDLPTDFDPWATKNLLRIQEEVLEEMVELFAASGAVNNTKRFFRDLHNREKQAVTAVGQGVVIPHVRTLQVRSFVMVFARSTEGIPYPTPEGDPVRLFIGLAAPPYDDRTYLKVYKSLAKLLLDPVHLDEFMNATESSEVLRTLELVC
jgi:mannitol/fructose-specific phosphotransferase system IIA component (Ntr-type)